MALVFTPVDNMDVRGRYKAVRCTATIASYTTGGEAVTSTHAAQCGLRSIVGIDIEDAASSVGSVWQFDSAVPEIFVRESGTAAGALAEQGSAENAGSVRCVVYGY